MEYEELKSLWEKYNSKLDNLEKLNKKLIMETLSRKSQRKINWHKFQSLYGLIAIPIIFVVALHPNFKQENPDWKFILGCILALLVIIYISFINIKSFSILKGINLSRNSVIESSRKIVEFKHLFSYRWKHACFYYPIIFAATILIAWNRFVFDTQTIISLTILFIVTYAINIISPRKYGKRIERLEKEISELKEYAEP
jgi:hypothetical protein